MSPEIAGYFKTIVQLRKNSLLVLKVRRQRMASEGCWDFITLIKDYYSVQKCMFLLAFIGVMQFFHNTNSLKYVRSIYEELAIIVVGDPYASTA